MSDLNLPEKFHALHFITQNVRICLDINYIRKVLLLAMLEPMPSGPDYLAGLLNIAGESIPVCDLAMCMGLQRKDAYSIDTPMLICTTGTAKTGLLVDKILGITELHKRELQMQTDFDPASSPFQAIATIDAELSLLINPGYLNKMAKLNDG
jgi:purine-binding chemotaxis protein CheW